MTAPGFVTLSLDEGASLRDVQDARWDRKRALTDGEGRGLRCWKSVTRSALSCSQLDVVDAKSRGVQFGEVLPNQRRARNAHCTLSVRLLSGEAGAIAGVPLSPAPDDLRAHRLTIRSRSLPLGVAEASVPSLAARGSRPLRHCCAPL